MELIKKTCLSIQLGMSLLTKILFFPIFWRLNITQIPPFVLPLLQGLVLCFGLQFCRLSLFCRKTL
jgi:hypothetical protein